MNSLIIICSLFLSSSLFGQSYEEGMKKAFEHWNNNEHERAAALFERIAASSNADWKAPYYAANVDIVKSFALKSLQEAEPYLKRAKKNIALAKERSPKNSEIVTLEGLFYTVYVGLDPSVYGMQYSAKIIGLHEQAIALDKDNPRAHLNLIEYQMGYASFMNEDLTPYCEKLEKVLPLFDQSSNGQPFAPRYGKERTKDIIASCYAK